LIPHPAVTNFSCGCVYEYYYDLHVPGQIADETDELILQAYCVLTPNHLLIEGLKGDT